VKSWLRLLRVSLAPSAAADAIAGLVFGHGGLPIDPRAWWLVGASLGVYHGALVLNDWHDRGHDAHTRGSRPIPSGAISAASALALAIGLFAAGIVCAFLVSPSVAAWMSVVALSAVVYDVAGRGPWLGPILLATCRAGNLGAGIFVAHQSGVLDVPVTLACVAPLLYGAYVFHVSRLGRFEDGEDLRDLARRPRALLIVAALCLAALALTPAPTPSPLRWVAVLLALAGGFGLVRAALTREPWTRSGVERAMGLALRRLLVASAVVALLGVRSDAYAGAVAASVILLGFPLSHALRRVAPPS